MLSDDYVLEIQKGKNPLITSFEDIVVHSDKISRKMLDKLALEYSETIIKFEEIMYLLSKLSDEVIEKLVLMHTDKLQADTDLLVLVNHIHQHAYDTLALYKNNIMKRNET